MTKPLTEGIPTTTAWREGRRIYIRCGYQSRTNTDLRDIGAKWDADERALWVGSTKADKVIEILTDASKRVEAAKTVKASATEAGLWVTIPYEAATIREQAKRLGARWDRDRKQWAMPTADTYKTIADALAANKATPATKAKARTEPKRATTETPDTILERAGRTTTGETTEVREVSTRRMNRATASASARRLGSIIRLSDGRRGIVTAVKVWFTGEDMASSMCWHPETHDEAHWDFAYTLAIVEPTADESAADESAAAERVKITEIDAVFADAQKAPRTEAGEAGTWSPGVIGPTIARCSGSSNYPDGHLVLNGDRVVYQHPGYFDDYRLSERASTDPALVSRVRALVAAGACAVGQYTIKASHA